MNFTLESPEPSETDSTDELQDSSEPPPRWSVMPAKFGQILEFLEGVSTSVNLFEKYSVSKYVEFFILTTSSTKRCPGLGTELAIKALERAKAKGFSLCVTEATSFYSQKIFTRMGFQTLAEIKFEDYKPNGEIIFHKHGVHESVKLMTKLL